MRIINLVLLLSLIGLPGIASGQDNGIGKGTRMITGMGSFSSSVSSITTPGDLNDDPPRLNTLSLSVSYDRFSTDHLFVGVGLSSLYQSLGSTKTGVIAVAPEIGYAFGNLESKVHPYFVGGCGMELSNENCGLSWSLGAGLIIPIQHNFGLVIESKYNNMNFLSSQPGVNTISINFGFVGLLF